MSETETEGTPAAEPEPTPGTGPSGAPESTPDAPEQTPEQEEAERKSKGDRRFAALTAQLSAAQREREAQRAELEFYRHQVAQQAPQDETPEQRNVRERAQIRAEVEAQIRTERFHEQGASAYGDWKQRCDDLVAMGADAGFAQLLVEIPDGVRVAAALAADPEAVQRIANLRSERARAVALGKYAAGIEGDAPQRSAAAPAVSRAPAPIRPVTGRAAPTFNEYTADGQTLVDRYMKQAMDRQVRR